MLYHWCEREQWEAVEDDYLPAAYDADGFVHCSFLHQVERTATSHDRGRQGLVLLSIDESTLPVIVEDCYELGEEYPHIYGSIPVDAVVSVVDFPPSSDGSFRLPSALVE